MSIGKKREYNFLIVDDSSLSRTAISKAIKTAGLGVNNIHLAKDGNGALKILNNNWIDLVFTDINMPGMGGNELINEMIEKVLLKTIPVIIISTSVSDEARRELEDKGIRSFINKPYTPEKIKDAFMIELDEEETEDQESTGLRVLIAEDDPNSQMFLKLFFKKHKNLIIETVEAVNNGQLAVDAFEKSLKEGRKFSLVCLDMMMPSMNGIEVLQTIRELEKENNKSASTILLITAVSQASTIMEAFKEQCDGYIVKPIDHESLTKKLKELNVIID